MKNALAEILLMSAILSGRENHEKIFSGDADVPNKGDRRPTICMAAKTFTDFKDHFRIIYGRLPTLEETWKAAKRLESRKTAHNNARDEIAAVENCNSNQQLKAEIAALVNEHFFTNENGTSCSGKYGVIAEKLRQLSAV